MKVKLIVLQLLLQLFQHASQPLEMVYMDEFGPISTAAITIRQHMV
jgi:hypothetical protein